MKLKYINELPDERTEEIEVLAARETGEGYPVPSIGDRVYIGDGIYFVWNIYHALDAADVPAFEEPDEIHVLVVTATEAHDRGWESGFRDPLR